MNQVTHQQVNQQLHIDSVDSGAPTCLKTKDEHGNNLEMPLVEYSNAQWAQLSSAKKTSIRKHHLALQNRDRSNPGRCSGGQDQKRPCENCGTSRGRGCGHSGEPCSKSDEYNALVASIATLSNIFNVIATCMGPGAASSKDDDVKPAADNKMKSNPHNSALTKNLKKEKE